MKLPHWAALALALAMVVVTWLMNESTNGQLVLPAAVLTGLTVVKTVLQMFTDQPASTPKKSSAGFVRFQLAAGLSLVAILVALVVVPRRVAREYGPAVQTSTAAVIAQDSTQGCGWLNSGGGAVVAQQGEAELTCILAQVLAGGNVPLDVLVHCAGGAFAALFSDLESLVSYYLSGAVDGGVAANAFGTACAAPGAKPPAANLPACIPSSALSALEAKHAEAKAKVGQ
jgi:hypothetical protein